MGAYSKEEEIKYLDVDKYNRLTNKALVSLMQDVAVKHADSVGDGLKDKEKTHTAWLLLNWKIRVFDRPKCDEILKITTWARTIDKCFSWREFEIYCEGKLVTLATSKWILVNSENEKITKATEEQKAKYAPNGKGVFEEEIKEKLIEPENMIITYEETIGRTKIDTNNHINNLYYLDYAIESLPEEVYENSTFNNIEIMYKKGVKYKDKIKCLYKFENNEHIVVIKSEDLKTLHAIIKLS